jgi:hypothetical protein
MIRDMIENQLMQLIDDDENERWLKIDFVDVSDADNPVVFFEDGATLTVRIFTP